ncbi:MAG: hypothetical protein J0I07_07970 [Myxococcales bacterium]|nr:hypothetical protein [Myxococcales bacterium]
MAVFDPREQRLCIRIVYDGGAGAGKTTNLHQLARSFAAQRKADVYSPGEVEGRTLYFDWLQIRGGLIGGFPVTSQVVSVPGQVVLTERRRHLLASADAVVYVADSTRSGVARAIEGLALLDELARSRPEPPLLVLQANKQDRPGALRGPELLEALGRKGSPCFEAIACDDVGVVDTMVAAVRAVAQKMGERLEREAVRVPLESMEGAGTVLRRLEQVEVDPEWAAEMALEEVAYSLLLDESASRG